MKRHATNQRTNHLTNHERRAISRPWAVGAALLGALLAITVAVPAPAVASNIQVDVRVASGGGWYGEEVWVEFTPQRSGWVAVYAAYSDGSLRPVFPTDSYGTHWVDAREVRVLPIRVPYGVRLVSVQAVASHRWFDPGDCRLVSTPSGPYGAWTFSIAWSSGSHSRTEVRSWGWGRPHGSHYPPYKPPKVRVTSRPGTYAVVTKAPSQAKTKHTKYTKQHGQKQKSGKSSRYTSSKSKRR